MKANRHILVLLSLLTMPLVPCFVTVPAVRTPPMLMSAGPAARDPRKEMEPKGPILLPPADYSKPATVVNLFDDPEAEIGHVMLNRKMTLSFTCNVCDGHSSYQINRVSFMQGIVVLWCQCCNQKHLIADNLGKLDFPEFGRNLEEFMAKKGTPVKRVVMSKEGLSHVVSEVPGPDYPEVNPHLVAAEGAGETWGDDCLPELFDGTSLLPGMQVGASGEYLSGIVPPEFGGGSGGGGVVDGRLDGEDAIGGAGV